MAQNLKCATRGPAAARACLRLAISSVETRCSGRGRLQAASTPAAGNRQVRSNDSDVADVGDVRNSVESDAKRAMVWHQHVAIIYCNAKAAVRSLVPQLTPYLPLLVSTLQTLNCDQCFRYLGSVEQRTAQLLLSIIDDLQAQLAACEGPEDAEAADMLRNRWGP